MGIHEEVEDLKLRIKKSVDLNNTGKTSDLLAQAFSVCETIKKILKTAGEKETKELNNIMNGLRAFLAAETARLSKKMGLTEDQMARYNENPENFSKEQWTIMQAIKKRFSAQTKEIKQVIKINPSVMKKNPPLEIQTKLPENLKDLLEGNPSVLKHSPPLEEVPKKKKVVLRKVKRDKWIKS